MLTDDYPALYVNADRASIKWQRTYLRMLLGQYFFILLAGCLTILPSSPYLREQTAIYLICVLIAAVLLLYMTVKKPQKEWYETRALAESIKTLTWRFIMRSGPFSNDGAKHPPRQAFKVFLDELVRSDGSALTADLAFGPQITAEMEKKRALTLSDRKDVYLQYRIRDQLSWYRRKSHFNRRRSNLFSATCVLLYMLGVGVALYQLAMGTLVVQWVSEPLLVTAAGIIGWMQAKRYEELAASYALAAHEIAQIEHNLETVTTEAEFDAFVAEAEVAFSREHTQWIARQTSPYDG
ncbi:DUF4231 domain-containing protein [Ciceribacter sp. L1K23]|uniref:DUF4231 domain-containing protein n=1 Tax=Ciceribacter sp. L1K23 TaxID=2820276 RepID=UPI001B817648|nr:DUF4231 domain-containing protein [Ciceribacter sp. L1K23]MBR0555764.1 DUF4231 domain-containing protein [Ciceribacter sp. L1K23]